MTQTTQNGWIEERQIPAKRKSVIAQDKQAPTPDLYGEMYRAAERAVINAEKVEA